MGFVQKKRGDEGDGAGGGAGLEMDLDLHACATCGRELLPWQSTCPDDGGRAVPRSAMAPPDDPHADRLAELLREAGSADDSDRDPS